MTNKQTRINNNITKFNTVLLREPLGTTYKEVQGYSSYYVLSNGKIWSNLRGTFLRQSLSWRGGYPQATLTSDSGQRRTLKTHSLIAHAFLDKPSGNNITCHHLNSIKQDNRLENICFVSHKQNIAYALKDGLIKVGDKHVLSKYDDQTILNALIDFKNGVGKKRISEHYGISQQYFNRVINGQLRRHLLDKAA